MGEREVGKRLNSSLLVVLFQITTEVVSELVVLFPTFARRRIEQSLRICITSDGSRLGVECEVTTQSLSDYTKVEHLAERASHTEW